MRKTVDCDKTSSSFVLSMEKNKRMKKQIAAEEHSKQGSRRWRQFLWMVQWWKVVYMGWKNSYIDQNKGAQMQPKPFGPKLIRVRQI
jgi:hypothetical protein